jgi:hypothetical protein
MKRPASIAAVLSAVLASAALAAPEVPNASDQAFSDSLLDVRADFQRGLPQAQAAAAGTPSADDLAAPAPDYTIVRRGDAYFIYGTGVASKGGGRIGGPVLEAGIDERVSEHWSLGFVHKNEGHPDDGPVGHRDGYAAMGWFSEALGGKTTLKLGAGPYFTMNTAMIDGSQRDDKNWGALVALAVVHRLNRYGLDARLQVDETRIPGQFNTTIVMAGLNQELGGSPSGSASAASGDGKTSYGAWAGSDVTNRTGQKGHMGYEADVQRAIDERFAYSVNFIDEGDSGLTARKGVAAQAWFVAPAAGKWTFSAGAGPYVADETEPGERGAKLLALISLKASRRLTDHVSLSCRMNRAASGYDKDADMFLCGGEYSE